jgi:hypothetical protein
MVSLEIGMVVHRSVSMASFWFEVRYAAMILCCGGVDGCFKYNSYSNLRNSLKWR